MKTYHDISNLRKKLKAHRQIGQKVAFVPTMGNLHAGHMSLVRQAKQQADVVVASIFVNPTQFGVGEDFERYPRTLLQDQSLLQAEGCDLLFAPDVIEMYGNTPALTSVHVNKITDDLCGASRLGHFTGVATIVTKLFNIVQPDIAFFGEKDYQQLAVIRQIVKDLNFDIEIIGVPTARAPDGLALSSRNQYLTLNERQHAPFLFQILNESVELIKLRNKTVAVIEQAAIEKLRISGFSPDYFSVRNRFLESFDITRDQEGVILVAARLGQTRLIDNLSFTL